MRLRLILTNEDGNFDITGMVTDVNWSGDYRQCCRTVSIGLVTSSNDNRVPVVACPVGAGLSLLEDGRELFSGYVFNRTKSTASNTMDLTSVDRGIYLKRNQASRRFMGVAPDAAAASICRDFGITTGYLEQTGTIINRKFLGVSLYEMLATMYTDAGKITGDAYHIGFNGSILEIRRKAPRGRVIVLKGGSNLMDATTTESGENIVNQAVVQDADGNTIYTMSDPESIAAYGQMQQVLRQNEADVMGQAKKLLEAAGVEQKITVNCLGDITLVTGGAVLLREEYTGLYGLFYIDSDVHTWKNGLHLCKLTLNFKAVMDEKSAGAVIEAAEARTPIPSRGSTGNFRIDRLR